MLDLDPAPPDDRGRVRFRVERDLGGVLSATFAFLRETWRELGWALLLVAGPVLLLTAVATFFFQAEVFGAMGGLFGRHGGAAADPEAATEEMMGAMFGPSYVVSLVGGIVGATLVAALVLGYVRLYRAGAAGRVTPGVLWAEASHAVLPVLGLAGLAGLLVMAAGLLSAAGCLGLVAWAALALYVLPLVALALAARVPGGRSFPEALAEARGLLRRHWGATVGVLLVAGLVWYAFAFALALPSTVALALTMFGSAGGDGAAMTGATRVLMAVGTLLGTFAYLFYAIPLVAAALHYFSLREREEGGGLAARVDALGGEPPARPEGPPAPPPLPPRHGDSPEPPGEPPPSGFRGRGFDDEA